MINTIIKGLLIVLFYSIIQIGYAQNLFFKGDKSYPCSESVKLDGGNYSRDLTITIAKDGEKGLLVVSSFSALGVLIKGKLLVYLDDGTVITCMDKGVNDYTNQTATSTYNLTKAELEKMIGSNLNAIRYSKKCGDCVSSTEEGDFIAKNAVKWKGATQYRTDFSKIVVSLFE